MMLFSCVRKKPAVTQKKKYTKLVTKNDVTCSLVAWTTQYVLIYVKSLMC